MTVPNGQPGNTIYKLIAKFAVSAIMLVALFWLIPYETVWETLKNIDLLLVAIALMIAALMTLVAALQIRFALTFQEIYLSVLQVLITNLRVKFYNLFLPGVLSGGVLRWYYLSKDSKKRAEVAATLAFNRFVDISVLCCVGVVSWVLIADERLKFLWPLIVMVSVLPVLFVFTFRNARLLDVCISFTKSPYCFSSAAARLDKILISLRLFPQSEPIRIAMLVLISAIRHSLAVLSTYVLALAVGIDVSLLMMAFAHHCLGLLMMFPLSFSGLGLRELSYVAILGLVAVPASESVALGLASYGRLLVFALLGATVEFCRQFIRPDAAHRIQG